MTSPPTDKLEEETRIEIDAKACGIIEAKREGADLGSVAEQSARYATSKTKDIQRWVPDDQALPLRNISQGSVKKIRIPLLSFAELKEVIIRVNQKIGGLQRLESEIEHQLVKAKNNKQSVLASVFSDRINQS